MEAWELGGLGRSQIRSECRLTDIWTYTLKDLSSLIRSFRHFRDTWPDSLRNFTIDTAKNPNLLPEYCLDWYS